MTAVAELAAALDVELALARARSLAYHGDVDAAANLLRHLDEAGTSGPQVWDLLARIHAQRGELAEADGYWRRVQDAAPGDPGAAAGRRAIADAAHRTAAARHPVLVAVVLAAVVGGSVAGGSAVTGTGDAAVDTATPPPAVAAGSPAEEADTWERRLAREKAAHDRTEARRARALEALARALRRPGVRVERRAYDVRLVFDNGLFHHGDQLTAEGRALLVDVGEALADLEVSTTVVGHAVAVPGGVTQGGSVVAMARAVVAAGVLAKAGGVPLTSFALRSADQRHPISRDPTVNRTVSLLVAPRSTPSTTKE